MPVASIEDLRRAFIRGHDRRVPPPLFHEGKLEEFKRLSAQAMEIVRTKDTGTLHYDTYFNDDQSESMVLERFRDSEALIEHAANLGDLTDAILATVSWWR
jgi:hypothetical protein